MATFYLDWEGGNDANAGTSFALKASAADGAITSTTFSSASASFPNDGSLIGQYLSIFNGSIYAVYNITAWVSSTSLTIAAISGGTALANTSARHYYIGGRWKTFTSGATAARTVPGDTIRVMASPDPTSLGSATWTGTSRPAAVNISSSTNATPIVITTSAVHGLVAGDYVSITGHNTNTNANGVWKVGTVGSTTTFQILQMDGTNTTGNGVGSGGTYRKATNCIVKLASPVTQNIALCGGLGQKPAWTASANVTCTQNTTSYKEGYSSAQIAIGAGFTTGLAAYYTLPAALNLSTYQQVTFWVQQTAGTIGAAGACYIALCSDTVGATVVNTVNIPALGALNVWMPVTVDLAGALGSSIQSVAFYVVTDNAAQTFVIDNIVACKASSSADSLNLTSLIGKNTSGDPEWYPLQSINYDAVFIGNVNSEISTGSTQRGYYGTSETVTTYKRETIKITPGPSFNTAYNQVQEGGTLGSPITCSGGWDRIDMSTQTGQTWWDGQNGNGTAYSVAPFNLSYITTDRLNAVRFTTGWGITVNISTVGNVISTGFFTGCGTGASLAGPYGSIGTLYVNNNANPFTMTVSTTTGTSVAYIRANNNTAGLTLASFQSNFGTIISSNNVGTGVALGIGTNSYYGSITAEYNTTYGISFGGSNAPSYNNVIGGGSTTGNTTAAINVVYNTLAYLNNFTLNEATEISSTNIYDYSIYFNRLDNTDNNNWARFPYGTINQQTSVIDSPATTAWKMSPTNATNITSVYPIKLKIGTVVCGASTLVTVTARMQRDNTGLTMRLVCPAGQISGVTTDVYTDMTAAANTWETVTITFTPTKAGAVDIYAYAFGGSTYSGYVCNLTASQA